MAIEIGRPIADNPAVKLAENTTTGGASDLGTISVLLRNVTATGSVWLGPSGVTNTTGFEWLASDGPVSVDLEPGESIYGYASTPQTIQKLKAGR